MLSEEPEKRVGASSEPPYDGATVDRDLRSSRSATRPPAPIRLKRGFGAISTRVPLIRRLPVNEVQRRGRPAHADVGDVFRIRRMDPPRRGQRIRRSWEKSAPNLEAERPSADGSDRAAGRASEARPHGRRRHRPRRRPERPTRSPRSITAGAGGDRRAIAPNLLRERGPRTRGAHPAIGWELLERSVYRCATAGGTVFRGTTAAAALP